MIPLEFLFPICGGVLALMAVFIGVLILDSRAHKSHVVTYARSIKNVVTENGAEKVVENDVKGKR